MQHDLEKHGSLGAGAARGAESRKVHSYEGCINPATQSFMPLASELSGRCGPLATRFFELVKGIGHCIGTVSTAPSRLAP